MKVKNIIEIIEDLAPLNLQEDYDNSGLQVGDELTEVRSVLVCLDVTEAVVEEAHSRGCQMIVSHHPLIFKALKCVSDKTYQQRCVVSALKYGISIYSAHTSLDNAPGGVCSKMAEKLNLKQNLGTSPLIGYLPEAIKTEDFLDEIKRVFEVKVLRHSEIKKDYILKVALCGGAGAFLKEAALAQGADCFITGEFHYHDYFEADNMLLVELGHYESEKCAIELISQHIKNSFPEIDVKVTSLVTNPIILL